ncbi:glycosyltransferase, partial [Streptomyces sp. NPDC001665]
MHASLTRQAVPWEAVIALDGADPSLLPAPLAADDRVRVLALPRPVGAACARNLALTQVRTPYVNWADDDDLFPDHAMSTRLEVLQRTDAGWCAGWSEDLHPDGSTTSESAQPESVVSTGPVPVPRTPTGDASSYEHGP